MIKASGKRLKPAAKDRLITVQMIKTNGKKYTDYCSVD